MRFFNSVQALYLAVSILLITVVIGHTLDVKNDTLYARHLEIGLRLQNLVRFDQELSGMLLLSVVEQNLLRATRYDTVRHDFQESLQTISGLTQDRALSQEIETLSESRQPVSAMEEEAIRLMKSEQWAEAREILFGDEYTITKKTYEIDIETLTGAIQGEVAAAERRFIRIKTVALFVRIAALLFLVWTGVQFSRRTRADLAEQARLNSEISAANTRLEARVLERTEELRLLLHSAGEGFFGVDDAGRVTFINPAGLRLLGYSEEEVIGKEVHRLIHHSHEDGSHYPADRCPMYATYRTGAEAFVTDEVLWRKDGGAFPVEYSSTPIGKAGEIIGAVVTFRDISGRKQAEMRFLASERKMMAMSQAVSDALVMVDSQGRVRFWNPAAATLFGYSDAEAMGRDFHEMAALPDDRDKAMAGLARFAETGKGAAFGATLQTTAVHRTGRQIPVEVSLSPFQLDDAWYAVGTVRDISDRIRVEGELARKLRSERAMAAISQALLGSDTGPETLEAALEHLVIAAHVDRVHVYENVTGGNDGLRMRLMYEACAPGIAPCTDQPDLCDLSYRDGLQRWQALLGQGQPVMGALEAFPESERSVLKARQVLSLVLCPLQVQGQWFGFVGFQDTYQRRGWTPSDVALLSTTAEIIGAFLDRRQAEMRFIASERKMKAMSRSVSDALVMIDSQGLVRFWNPAAEALFGYSAEEAMGREFHQMATLPEDRDKATAGLRRFAATGEGAVFGTTIQATALNRTGGQLPVEVSLSSFQLDNAWYAVGTVRDITERKQIEAQIQAAREELLLIFDSSQVGIMFMHGDCDLARVNRRLAEILGYGDPKEMIGFNMSHLHLDESSYLNFKSTHHEVMLRGEQSQCEYRLKKRGRRCRLVFPHRKGRGLGPASRSGQGGHLGCGRHHRKEAG